MQRNAPRKQIEVTPVGVIHSPYKRHEEAPRQGRFSDAECNIEIFPKYAEGLRDVEDSPHLILLYWLDRAERDRLTAIPPHDPVQREHGVFATRSPNRPNPIGFAVVDLIRREENRLFVRGLDALDGTPVVDIKPYSKGIDCVKD